MNNGRPDYHGEVHTHPFDKMYPKDEANRRLFGKAAVQTHKKQQKKKQREHNRRIAHEDMWKDDTCFEN